MRNCIVIPPTTRDIEYMKTNLPPKRKYQILIPNPRPSCFDRPSTFEVEAECVEKACQIVLAEGATSVRPNEKAGLSQLDPAAIQEKWIIMRTTPPEYCDYLLVQEWNGRFFKSIGKVPVGADIVQAARKLSLTPRQ
jgi:hypothetical protein